MNEYDNPLTRLLYPILASVAGAITALSFRSFQNMTKTQISLTIFVGFSFAMFVAPWVNYMIFGEGPVDIRILGGVFYLLASGSNILLPFAIKKIGKAFGYETEPET